RLSTALDNDSTAFAADAHQRDWSGERDVHAHTTLRRGALFRELFPGLHLDHLAAAETGRPTVSAHGAAMLVRRSAFIELGGFDETFFLDFEDLDLCWRAWLRGQGSIHVPETTIRHRVGAATGSNPLWRRLVSSHHNLMRFALKCLPSRDARRVIITEFV